MKKNVLLLFFLCIQLFNLRAENEPLELIGTPEAPMVIENGQTYIFDKFGRHTFSFTSTEDGVLTLTLSGYCKIFSGTIEPNSETNEIEFITERQMSTDGNNMFFQGIEAGKTYYFQHDFTWGNEITMNIQFTAGPPYIPVALTQTIPESGSIYSVTTSEGNINFVFNQPINTEVTTISLILPDGSKEEITNFRIEQDFTTNGTILTVLLATTYQTAMNAGKIKEGEKFKILIENVCEKDRPENCSQEEISATFTAAPQAVEYIGSNKEESINSYYVVGDTEGLIEMSFTDLVDCTAESAILFYGDREDGSYREISLPYEVKGKNIVINLQGIPLNKSSLNENTVINIKLSGIKDTKGYYIIGNTNGSPGTITLTFNVVEIEVNIFSEFTPNKGNIDNVDEIEIWIAQGNYLMFDGVMLTYTKNGATTNHLLSKEELRIESDPASIEDLLIYVPLKDIYFEAGEVSISVYNGIAINGSKPEIQATYTSVGKSDPNTIRPNIHTTATQENIYNLQGVKVGTGNIKEILQELPTGIYIINGEKVTCK